ncbi:unnamed protein product [Pedinophyceae sp. YPF-701]|nr:unnamed protein product [Pedinophyceae sp. YPF-701]
MDEVQNGGFAEDALAGALFALEESVSLLAREDPETQPYRSKYEASDRLEGVADELKHRLQQHAAGADAGRDEESRQILEGVLAAVETQRGLALASTDLTADARRLLERSIPALQKPPGPKWWGGVLQQALNQAAILASNSGEHDLALRALQQAEQLYVSSNNPATPPDGTYQLTLFYLAQVHGLRKDSAASAEYCAATLRSQLELAAPDAAIDVDEWVGNALGLAEYYLSEDEHAACEWCLHAATRVLKLATGEVEPGAGEGVPLTAPRDVEAAGAKVDRAWLRLLEQRLLTGALCRDRGGDGGDADGVGRLGSVPPALHFQRISLPAEDALPWGRKAIPSDFASARDIFNAAMRHLRGALAYFVLDGFVTDHFELQMDAANLYRCLSRYEEDPKRRAAMHGMRAKVLAPLCDGNMNPQHFLGIIKSVHLECASALRDQSDIKAQVGDAAGAARAAATATVHYKSFLRCFPAGPCAEDKPARTSLDKVAEDVEEEALYLRTLLQHVAVVQRVYAGPGGGNLADLQVALTQLKWAVAYAERHKVPGFEQEAALASEMSDLLEQKIDFLVRQRARAAAS